MRKICFQVLGFLLFWSRAAAESPYVCEMGGYQYTGAYYSHSYQTSPTEGVKACDERKQLNAEKLGEEHRLNRSAISASIDKILADPQCLSLHELVKKYREDLAQHKSKFEGVMKVRRKILEANIKDWDVQRTFAYIALFNTTCAGGYNRKSSFIDLDLINKIPLSEPAKTIVTTDGEQIENCAHVEASGDDDLNEFAVTMKQATGESFHLDFDAFGIPDQVQVKNSSGDVIYDSGCNPGIATEDVPLRNLGNDRKAIINILNNCENPSEDGVSVWNLLIQCKQEPSELCQKPKEELIELLKKEVELTKKFLEINWGERTCLEYMDETALPWLLQNGFIRLQEGFLRNYPFCDSVAEDCELKREGRLSLEKNRQMKPTSVIHQNSSRTPALSQAACSKRPLIRESILEHVSWAYCTIGRKRLGLD